MAHVSMIALGHILLFALHLADCLDFSAIGFEFELINIHLQMKTGKFKDADEARALKGKPINQFSNQQWQSITVNVFTLTADIVPELENGVTFEFVADASRLPLSDPNIPAKGEEITRFIKEQWDPLGTGYGDKAYRVEGSNVLDWRVVPNNDPVKYGPEPKTTKDIASNAHITAAMSLNGIQRLFRWGQRGQESVLRPKELVHPCGWNLDVYVTEDFFKSSPNGITPSQLNNSTLGFLSLMMSVAKSAAKLDSNQGVGPKLRFYIMPRTSWLKLYALAAIPGISGSNTLYELARTLSCYKWNNGKIGFDDDYCNIWSRKPEKEFEKRGWVTMISRERASQLKSQGSPLSELISNNPFGKERKVTLTVRKYMEGLQAGTDWLRLFDTLHDSQIGALGDAMEPLFDGSGLAPILEFRSPFTLRLDQFSFYMYIGVREIKQLQKP